MLQLTYDQDLINPTKTLPFKIYFWPTELHHWHVIIMYCLAVSFVFRLTYKQVATDFFKHKFFFNNTESKAL